MKLIIFVIALTYSLVTHAELKLVATDASSKEHYIDTDTIRITGDKVRVWIVTNLKPKFVTPSPNASAWDKRLFHESNLSVAREGLSQKSAFDFNCKEEEYSLLSLIVYSKEMGEGAVIRSTDNDRKWNPIVPGSVIEHIWKYACGVAFQDQSKPTPGSSTFR